MQVIIKPWENEDVKPLVNIANNIKIWNNLRDYFPHPYTIGDATKWINAQGKIIPSQDMAIRMEDILVGGVGIMMLSDVNRRSVEIGYFVGERYWNKGIASEAVRQMTTYVFANFDIVRIFAVVFQKNKKSMKVLENAGYELEAIHKKAVFKNGEIMDEYVYTKFRDN